MRDLNVWDIKFSIIAESEIHYAFMKTEGYPSGEPRILLSEDGSVLIIQPFNTGVEVSIRVAPDEWRPAYNA